MYNERVSVHIEYFHLRVRSVESVGGCPFEIQVGITLNFNKFDLSGWIVTNRLTLGRTGLKKFVKLVPDQSSISTYQALSLTEEAYTPRISAKAPATRVLV